MEISLRVLTRFGLRVGAIFLLALPAGYAVYLVWQEWQFREQLARPSPTLATITRAPAHVPLDATAVATMLGLTTQITLLASAEPMTLQASFVVSNGMSRALLADAQGPRMYQVGERLPGGSVLRRVEANQVVLWNKGREERLTLQPSAERLLRRLESAVDTQTPAISARFLRPLSGPSE
ncbi:MULTISPECIES: type II secretion system protein N [unclassified Pseudomonas]|uniref:Type II secretion system protein N n=1 Tax=Pseudomonas sp. MYb327 TaxID=2745230 RepID=A0AAU8DYR0_9PSED